MNILFIQLLLQQTTRITKSPSDAIKSGRFVIPLKFILLPPSKKVPNAVYFE